MNWVLATTSLIGAPSLLYFMWVRKQKAPDAYRGQTVGTTVGICGMLFGLMVIFAGLNQLFSWIEIEMIRHAAVGLTFAGMFLIYILTRAD